ncbi:MAG TPA: serine/threonine-protein kinase [Haliangium sp.]|nr:serine/threonine-protein kinase [Haliangium sp.]
MGRYHLAEPLGGGPTGEVYRAKVYGVAGFEREFAIKRFHPEFVSHPDIAAKLATAARNYGSLEHPRIARLHEYGVAGGETFTATELVQGVDTARMVSMLPTSDQTLPLGAAIALVSQAARAVGYAHGRGLFHLGLCPTNVLVTPDGDVKITDFCFLPTRLPDRPGDDPTLRARMPYLAPEQLVGEPTGAATDVYQLGVIAYEVLTGRPPFTGATSPEIAQQILASRPRVPGLPPPLLEVTQRCLKRSPFERFPDARALADALDAAVRAAQAPGDHRDLAVVVRALMAKMSEVSDGQSSGAVSFPLPSPPRAAPHAVTDGGSDRLPSYGPDGTLDAVRAELFAQGAPGMGVGPGGRLPTLDDAGASQELGYLEEDLPTTLRSREDEVLGRPRIGEHTAPGLVSPRGRAPTPPPRPGSAPPSGRPPVPARPPTSPGRPGGPASGPPPGPGARLGPGPGPGGRPGSGPGGRPGSSSGTGPGGRTVSGIGPGGRPGSGPGPAPGPGAAGSAPPFMDEGESAIETAVSLSQPLGQTLGVNVGDSAPAHEELGSVRTVIGVPGMAAPGGPSGRGSQGGMPAPPPGAAPSGAAPPRPPSGALPRMPGATPPAPQGPGAVPAYPRYEQPGARLDPLLTPPPTMDRASGGALVESMPLPSPPKSEIMPAAVVMPDFESLAMENERTTELDERVVHTELHDRPRPKRGGLVAVGAVAIVALLAGGYVVYQRFVAGGEQGRGQATGPAATPADAGAGQATGPDRAVAATGTPGTPGTTTSNPAGSGGEARPAQPDENSATRPAQRAAVGGTLEMQEEPRDKLVIRSKPERAKVYLDGSLQGKTPLTLDATADQHNVAVVQPGHRLFTAEIKGHGTVDITLEEVAPPGGEGGIKIRCRNKDRYYVFLDGNDSGQLCPTERIGADVGEHVIEIYDPETESRQQFPINVEQTRRSTRLRVD